MPAPDFHPIHGRLLTYQDWLQIPWMRLTVKGEFNDQVMLLAQLVCSVEASKRIQATLAAWFEIKQKESDLDEILKALEVTKDWGVNFEGLTPAGCINRLVAELGDAYAEIAELKGAQ